MVGIAGKLRRRRRVRRRGDLLDRLRGHQVSSPFSPTLCTAAASQSDNEYGRLVRPRRSLQSSTVKSRRHVGPFSIFCRLWVGPCGLGWFTPPLHASSHFHYHGLIHPPPSPVPPAPITARRSPPAPSRSGAASPPPLPAPPRYSRARGGEPLAPLAGAWIDSHLLLLLSIGKETHPPSWAGT